MKNTIPTREGYVFKGWKANDGSDTIYTGGMTCAVSQYGNDVVKNGNTWTRTLYAVWEEAAPPMPDKPTAPGEGDLSGLIGNITVNCTNEAAAHELKTKGYALISGSYTTGEVEGDAENGYTYTVTINSQKYVEQFDTDTGAAHDPKGVNATVTLKYTDNGWTVESGAPVVFDVACVTEIVPPARPGAEDLSNLKAPVDVTCTTKPETHAAVHFSLRGGTYTIGDVAGNETDGYTCDITVTADKYVARYNMDYGKHTLTGDNTKTLTLKYVEGQWAVDTPITFPVECGTAPETTYTVTYTDGVENEEIFADQVYGNLLSGTATPAFNGTPTRAGYKFLGWEPTVAETVTENATYVAQWEKLYTVTYTDGVDGKAFKDDVHSDLEKDTPTPAFSGDTPTRKGFVFDGWNPEVAETVTEDVTYTAQWKPVQPDKKAIEGAIGRGVAVVCDNQNVKHGAKAYKVTLGEYSVSNVMGTAADGYTCTVTVRAAKFIEKYSSDMSDAVHTLIAGEPAEKTIELKWNGEKWVAKTELPITFHVECPPEKPTYDELKGLGINAKVDCTTTTAHNGKSYTLIEGTYDVSDPERKGTAYTCILTVNAKDYVAKYNAEENVGPHTLDDRDSKTIELTWNGEKWTAAETSVTFNVKCELLTVTYTDGVKGEEVFADVVYKDIPYGTSTPAFGTKDPTREGYKFVGWEPEVAETVTKNVTYTAKWEKLYTVTYTDGAKGKAFKDQVYKDLESGTDTPKFDGKPTRKGYTFTGWSPKVTDTVTKDVTYVAQWKSVKNGKDNIPKTGDSEIVMVLGSVLLFSFCGAAAVSVYDRKRKHF